MQPTAITSSQLLTVVLICSELLSSFSAAAPRGRVSCYDETTRRAQRCFPPFINAAFNVTVEATDTCGGWGRSTAAPEYFCQQTGAAGATKSCDVCDATDPAKVHPPSYLTDFHRIDRLTWWQSSTMLEDVQYPQSVNLSLSLGKAFEITYVRLKFHSSRPESFAIYRRLRRLSRPWSHLEEDLPPPSPEEEDWKPYQFYSASCLHTYGLEVSPIITRDNEARAICRDDLSDISPLTGGSVAFSTLEGRPSAYDFENSDVLQDWVTATDVRIVLNRINTFRDEVFGDPNVLRSYFYAVSDFAVGGRCKCNGHASECVRQPGSEGADGVEGSEGGGTLMCRCEHNTMGMDCEQCLPFYNDQPWRRARQHDAYECQPCNCNGKSDRCYFDPDLFALSGHGGHCVDCLDNSGGPNCERCADGYYLSSSLSSSSSRYSSSDLDSSSSASRFSSWDPYSSNGGEEDERQRLAGQCLPCGCHPLGSETMQCAMDGVCQCKAGVEGRNCDQCQHGYHTLGPDGCSACQCVTDGCVENEARCHPDSGQCHCKENVEGINCDTCKMGYFGLSSEDPLGCMPCFCYGHSTACQSSLEFSKDVIKSTFELDDENWTGASVDDVTTGIIYNEESQSIQVNYDDDAVYFVAPVDYLGDQRLSYNQLLSFHLSIISDDQPRASYADIIIEGEGLQVTSPIFAQSNDMPSSALQSYSFRLNEHQRYQWSPTLTSFDFVRLLSNVTALKIRANYGDGLSGSAHLSNVSLGSAISVDDQNGGEPAYHVEMCQCPLGYVGQFCESCAPGYRRDPRDGGPLASCVPCQCNGHASECDADTGLCICDHNTTGPNCELCLPGFYGFAVSGTPNDCTICPCPSGVNCVELLNRQVACYDCPLGYTGQRCEVCDDGYYGDLSGSISNSSGTCEPCNCSNNIDSNAVGNCDRLTGECLRCVYNTTGFQCDQCLPGYYGDALKLPHGQCFACDCFNPGSQANSSSSADGSISDIQCDIVTGLCPCLPNIVGRRCDQCEPGFWNITSGKGCEECDCGSKGSTNSSCNIDTGECQCRAGVGGRQCDQCAPNHFNSTSRGCIDCRCSFEGSVSLQCSSPIGQCPCRPNIVGQRCDQCEINKYNLAAGCIDCPVCYNTVHDHVRMLRKHVVELRETIRVIETTPPQEVNSTEFTGMLADVNETVVELLQDARRAGIDPNLVKIYHAVIEALRDLEATRSAIDPTLMDLKLTVNLSNGSISAAERALDQAEKRLEEAQRLLDEEGWGALERAAESRELHGEQSQQMTTMSREARELAQRQEAEAKSLLDVANMALNNSEEAFKLFTGSQDSSRQAQLNLRRIQNQLYEVRDQAESVQLSANNSLRAASEAYHEALAIYTEAESIRVVGSPISADTVKQDAENITLQAQELLTETERLLREKWRDLKSNVEQEKEKSRDALSAARSLQASTDALMADVNNSRTVAMAAVATSEKTLEEANSTLNTLLEFDTKVQESRLEAEQALTQIPEIEQQIVEAEKKTREAKDGLDDAEGEAVEAEETATEAFNITTRLVEDMTKLANETATLKYRHLTITNDSTLLATSVEELEERVRRLEEMIDKDAQLIKEKAAVYPEKLKQCMEQTALQNTGSAKSKTVHSQEKVAKALRTVDEILEELAALSAVDLARLDELEGNLVSVERNIISSEVDRRFSEVGDLDSRLSSWVEEYSAELERLEEDVENIRQINDTIPMTCHKKISLEPVEFSG